MKNLYCWRCKMEVPMLDEAEFEVAQTLYGNAFKAGQSGKSLNDRFQPLLDYYTELTGFEETIPNAIMHHRISQYGTECENCGKPYRTPLATFCAGCGNKK